MNKQPYIIPSQNFSAFKPSVVFAVLLPIFGFFTRTAIGTGGVVFVVILWLAMMVNVFVYFKFRNERVEISDSGIVIKRKGKNVSFMWDEIEKIGFQPIGSKKMGMYEAYTSLSMKVINSSKSKIESIVSSREYGFLRKAADFTGYMSKGEKLDLYINTRFVDHPVDTDIIQLLSSKQSYVSLIDPMAKTTDLSEYDNFFYGKRKPDDYTSPDSKSGES